MICKQVIFCVHTAIDFCQKGFNISWNTKRDIGTKKEFWEYFNHMLTIIDPDTLTVGEAIAEGYDIHNIYKKYSEEDINQMIVIRPYAPFTNAEQQQIITLAEEWDAKGIKYEFTNFLWWMPYIYSKGHIYLGPKGDKVDDKLFCFEAALMLWDEAREMFEHPGRETTISTQLRDDVWVMNLIVKDKMA